MDSLESIGFPSIPWNAGCRIHWIPFPFLFVFFALCLLKVFGILPDAWPNSFYSTPCARAPRALRARFARAKPTQAADHQSSGRTNWFAAGARASRARSPPRQLTINPTVEQIGLLRGRALRAREVLLEPATMKRALRIGTGGPSFGEDRAPNPPSEGLARRPGPRTLRGVSFCFLGGVGF